MEWKIKDENEIINLFKKQIDFLYNKTEIDWYAPCIRVDERDLFEKCYNNGLFNQTIDNFKKLIECIDKNKIDTYWLLHCWESWYFLQFSIDFENWVFMNVWPDSRHSAIWVWTWINLSEKTLLEQENILNKIWLSIDDWNNLIDDIKNNNKYFK